MKAIWTSDNKLTIKKVNKCAKMCRLFTLVNKVGMTGQLSNQFIRDLEAIHQLISIIEKQRSKS